MERRLWKSVLTFILVLALTIGTVAALSMATSAKADTASERYSEQVRASQEANATELSAVIPEERVSPIVSIASFAAILFIPALCVFIYMRSRLGGRRARRTAHRRRSDVRYSTSVVTRRV